MKSEATKSAKAREEDHRMLTRKQLDAWNNADEREIQQAIPGSPRFLICNSVVNGGPRNGEPGPRIAIWFATAEEYEELDASPSRSKH
jgi:hypothetical protein